MTRKPKGPQAARLRQKKFELLKTLRIPWEALPGSLTVSHTRCGKPRCHCRREEGHSAWSLTFMVQGRKRVERIPKEWVEQVRKRVDQGRAFKEAWTDVLVANAELLVLERKQSRG